MKKTINQAKKNSFVVVAATILEKKQTFEFIFEEKECQALAKRFDLPKVLSFSAHLDLYRDEFIHVKGEFLASVVYKSVISLEEFHSQLKEKIDVLFSENPPAQSDEIIDPVEQGRIDLKEVLFEQFGLALAPFPKKPEEQETFIYQEEDTFQTPFQKLKEMMKK